MFARVADPAPTSPSTLAGVKAALLAWYRANGRDLPWRRTRDPYAVLVSEVMLQQTPLTGADLLRLGNENGLIRPVQATLVLPRDDHPRHACVRMVFARDWFSDLGAEAMIVASRGDAGHPACP